MPVYLNQSGEHVSADCPERLIWYGPRGCCYWTDDWSKLGDNGRGIPTCPSCGSPGFQCEFGKWMEEVELYQRDGHPKYIEFLEKIKEKCYVGMRSEELYNYYISNGYRLPGEPGLRQA